MTGYGEGSDLSYGRLSLTLCSVNYKSLHIDCKLPPLCACYEECIRRKIKQRVERGRLTLTLEWSNRPDAGISLSLNSALIEKLRPHMESTPPQLWSGAGMSLGLIEKVEAIADKGALEKSLHAALDQALEEFVASKQREGKELLTAIDGHLQSLHDLVHSLDSAGEKELMAQERRKRLEGLNISDERAETEIALLIEKSDVTEEIDRIAAHLREATNILLSPCIAKGKRLDFLLQELARESATLTCKVAQIDSKRLGIEMRSTVEKIREQVANVE